MLVPCLLWTAVARLGLLDGLARRAAPGAAARERAGREFRLVDHLAAWQAVIGRALAGGSASQRLARRG